MDIDSLYEWVLNRLNEKRKIVQISQELLVLTGNDDIVLQVYGILEDLKVFPTSLTVNKSTIKSASYRNVGNKYFQSHKDYEAWQYYNLALSHAPLDSEDYVLALANRSAVFFSLQKYKECLKDIEIVIGMNYPQKLMDKLLKRQASCKELLKNPIKDDKNYDPDSIYSMKGSRNTRYPCASDSVKVMYNYEMGHHVVAKRDIEVGELLVEENPYFLLLLKSQILFSCSYCLSRMENLLPCNNCCFSLYCSELCKEKSLTYYHKFECPILANLLALKFTKLELLALRTVIKARCEQPDWESLLSVINKAEANVHSEYRGCTRVNDRWVYDSLSYTPIHALASNVEKRSVSDIFRKAVTAAVFLYMLKKNTDFLKEATSEINKCVGGLLLHHVMTSPTNMHGISGNACNEDGKYTDDISLASAPYAFLSLLNHSCAPNVVRFSNLGSGRKKLFAIRPIKKGMQLLDNYGAHHAMEDRDSRRSTLQFQYKFSCNCEACVGNWPNYLCLPNARNLPMNIRTKKEQVLSRSVIENLERGCIETAKKSFKPLCELISVLDNYAPCVELADCQESLKQCLAIFEGLLPYGFSQLIEWEVEAL